MKGLFPIILITVLLHCSFFIPESKPEVWGFYGHRLINRMAVFTLSPELYGFYRNHIDYITEHAVDPDKRRYASKFEDIRHYIDLDHWGTYPYENLTRDFEDDIIRHTLWTTNSGAETDTLKTDIRNDSIYIKVTDSVNLSVSCDYPTFLTFWKKNIKPLYYEDQWQINKYDLDDLFHTDYFTRNNADISFADQFSKHGILPYHLEEMMHKLTRAFEHKNHEQILRLSAEIGHYIGDAHVPLHTTSNYNGQLTGQHGIHAFWESRIPELLATENYMFLTGKAVYIEDVRSFFWNTVLASNKFVAEVLEKERLVSGQLETDALFCFEKRLNVTIKTQCPEFVKAYSASMGSMVEDRMVSAAHALGSCIFTAWILAGQPELPLGTTDIPENNEVNTQSGITPREHENGDGRH
jgi:hypothetical protein